MTSYGDDNKDYSDSQRLFNEGKIGYSEGIVDVVQPSKPNFSSSKGVSFCPRCNSMMFNINGRGVCNTCGYETDDLSKKVPPIVEKQKTFKSNTKPTNSISNKRVSSQSVITKNSGLDTTTISDLERIASLYERGILTRNEFNELKRRLIG